MLTQKLLKQGYVAPRLKPSLQKLYVRHHNLVDRYEEEFEDTKGVNIHISNDNGSFSFYVDAFFPLSLPRLLPDLTVYMSNTVVSYKMQKLHTRHEHLSSPTVFGGARVANLFGVFVVLSYYVSLPFEFYVVMPVTISHKNDVRSSLSPVVCGRTHILFTLFVCVCL